MLAEVSPSANRFITAASPLSGRVMLRPISQQKPSPMRTAARPTPMMMIRVRFCEADRVAEAVLARCCAKAIILSASGSICSLSRLIVASKR